MAKDRTVQGNQAARQPEMNGRGDRNGAPTPPARRTAGDGTHGKNGGQEALPAALADKPPVASKAPIDRRPEPAVMESSSGAVENQTQNHMPAKVSITIPVGPPADGYRTDNLGGHVDTKLNTKQRDAVLEMLSGLRRVQSRLEDGRFVNSGPDVVRWIAEQAANQTGWPRGAA